MHHLPHVPTENRYMSAVAQWYRIAILRAKLKWSQKKKNTRTQPYFNQEKKPIGDKCSVYYRADPSNTFSDIVWHRKVTAEIEKITKKLEYQHSMTMIFSGEKTNRIGLHKCKKRINSKLEITQKIKKIHRAQV